MRERVWREGEQAALAEYQRRGYRLLARNWSCRLGELDLVLSRKRLLIVCEVKARTGSSFGGPYEAVTPAKQRKIRAVTEAYLAATGNGAEGVRFDVASVGPGPRVHLFEDAF